MLGWLPFLEKENDHGFVLAELNTWHMQRGELRIENE